MGASLKSELDTGKSDEVAALERGLGAVGGPARGGQFPSTLVGAMTYRIGENCLVFSGCTLVHSNVGF